MPLETSPGVISLLVGKPNTAGFPIKSLSFTSQDPNDPSKDIEVDLTPEELDLGLQYSPTAGIPQLVDWLYKLQEVCHGRKQGEGWKLSIGNGSQDLMYKVMSRLYVDPKLVAYLQHVLTGRHLFSEPGRPRSA